MVCLLVIHCHLSSPVFEAGAGATDSTWRAASGQEVNQFVDVDDILSENALDCRIHALIIEDILLQAHGRVIDWRRQQ